VSGAAKRLPAPGRDSKAAASAGRRGSLALGLALGLIAAGALSLSKLDIQASTRASFPEITVSYAAPPGSSPVDTGRLALGAGAPLLREIRALGGVTGVAGEARTGGAEIHVRFAAGNDPEVKALRLSRALAARGRSIGAFAVRAGTRPEGDLAAVLWLGGLGDEASRSLAEELRSVPGVRSVDRHGGTREQLRYRLPLPPGREADAVRRRLARSLEARPLGRSGGPAAREAVRADTGGSDPSELVLPGGVRLGTLAERRLHHEPLPSQTHLGGRPGRALWIWRESDAPPLRLSRDLHRKLDELALPPGTRLLLDETGPLRRQLFRLAAGLLLAALLLGLGGLRLGGRRLGAAGLLGPLAAAGAGLLALRAFDAPLDTATLSALPLAAGASALAGLVALGLRADARQIGRAHV
jgi:multidrug efflux pump subunit AcrB